MSNKQINVFMKFQGDVSDISNKIKSIQGDLNNLNLKPQLKNSFGGLFGNLETELNKYKSLLQSDLTKKVNLNNLEKSGNEITKIFNQIEKKMEELNNKEFLQKQLPTDIFKKYIDELNTLEQKIEEIKNKKIEFNLSDGTKEVKTIEQAFEDLKNKMNFSAGGVKFKEQLREALSTGDLEKALQLATELQNRLNTPGGFKGKAENLIPNQQAVDQFIQQLQILKSSIPQAELDNLKNTIQQINQTKQAKIEFNDEQLRNISTIFDQLIQKTGLAKKGFKDAENGVRETTIEMTRFGKEVDMLKNRVQYFFSLTNSVMLFRRAIRSALTTVKELDATMTEAAVVTEFSVGDMWDKLPEYAANASKLGATINDLYGATTLYYQQGLKTEQAMSLGIETMKMARIAGLEGEEATSAMTAALRGFNMELNETSAQRVNDVYSKLAAITAADTEQIATAMTKTASIASSANMEFETTAALLSQIIETTQEAPETAGTAMKTIIARFTEVKELFNEGQLTGKDEEGEEININKIDAALKTVGISLKEFLLGSKGIDDIFLELASKWDTLDLATQRYIATTAAGSRQQSRFIAMMSDYGRTTELVSAANNSAGASQEQFEKTLDSMQSKINQLKDAWNQYLMGLANNEILKVGIDLLTQFITGINNIVDSLGGNNGLAKSFLSLGIAIIGLRAASNVFDFLIAAITKHTQATLANAGVIKIDSEVTKENTKLKQVNAMANLKFYLIILAIIAVIWILVKAYEALNKNSPEKQFERASKAAEEAKKAAEEVKESYSNLTSTLDSLEESYSTLEDLTRGTEEWNAKVQEINGSVLELISNYKELAPFVTSENGVLKLDYNKQIEIGRDASNQPIYMTVESIILEEGKEVYYAQIASAQAEINKAQKRRESEQSQINKGKIEGTYVDTLGQDFAPRIIQGTLYNYSSEIAYQIAEAVKSGEIFDNNIDLSLDKNFIDFLTNKGYIPTNEELDELSEFDQEYYREFVSLMNSSSEEYRRTLYWLIEEQGMTFENAQQIVTLFGEIEDFSLENYNNLVLEEAEIEGFISQVISASMALAEFENTLEQEAAENIDDDILENIYNKAYDSAYDANTEIDAQEKAEFADYKNYKYEEGKFYDAQGTEITQGVDDESIRVQLASIDASEKLTDAIENLANQFVDNEKLAALFSKDGVGIDKGMLEDLVPIFNKQQYNALTGEAITSFFGYEGSLGQMAMEYGFGEGTEGVLNLLTFMEEQFNTAEDRIQDQQKKMYSTVLKNDKKYQLEILEDEKRSNLTRTEIVEKNIQESLNEQDGILNRLQRYDEDTEGAFSEELIKSQNILSIADDDIISSNMQELIFNTMDTFDGIGAIQEINRFIEDIPWENPIEALNMITKQAEISTGATKQAAETLLECAENGSSFFSTQSQINYLFTSEDYSSISESIGEILKEQEELSSQDMQDLIDDYDILEKFIENTGATASGLAKIFNQISSGKYSFEQITQAVLKATSELDSFDNLITDILNTLKEFDPGRDENEVASFMEGAYETLSGNLDKGAVGNSQNFEYLDFLFGEDWRKVQTEDGTWVDLTGDALVEKIEYYTDLVEKNSADMRQSFIDLINGVNSRGEEVDLSNWGLSVGYAEDGSIELLGYEGKTTSEIVEALAEAYDVTKEYAAMMLADFSNYSADLAQELAENDLLEANKIFFSSGRESLATYRSINNQDQADNIHRQFFDMSEIEMYAESSDQDAGVLASQARSQGAIVTDFYDEEGLLVQGEQLLQQFDLLAGGAGASTAQNFLSNFKTEAGAYDYSSLLEGLMDLGFSEEQATELAQTLITSVQKELDGQPVDIQYTLDDGSTAVKQFTEETTLIEQEVAVKAEVEQDALQGVIEEALSNVEINLELSDEVLAEMAELEEFILKLEDGTEISIWVGSEDKEKVEEEIKGVTGKDYQVGMTVTSTELNSITTQIQNALDEYDFSIQVKATITSTSTVPPIATTYSDARALSGYVPRAKGIINSPTSHDALTGEEGPELVQTKKGAYITGANGPQISHINKGDTVYTAKETKKIFSSKKAPNFPRYARGYVPKYGYSSSNKSGGRSTDSSSSNSNSDAWENGFDKLYNLVREIDEELRQRERIERRYEKLLENIDVNANKILENSKEELKQLEKELQLQKELEKGRKQQIEAYQNENSDLLKYAGVDTNERGEQVLRIDWDAIDAITDKDLGERVDEFVGQLEEWFDEIYEVEENINDIEDTIKEINERGKDEYLDIESQVRDALEQQYQDQIDKLSEINDSINDTNSRLLDAVQSSLDKVRQDRENAETEEELSDKQHRLEYLRQDTSGANDLEILQLEEEIREGQQDYTDTLIDQKISELQEQNDKAAEQREKQIQLAQAQLDHYLETGEIWNEAYDLMDEGLSYEKNLVKGSELESLLKSAEGFQGMSHIQQMDWMDELNKNIASGLAYIKLGRQLENLGTKAGTKVKFTTSDGRTIEGTVNNDGSVTSGGKKYTDVYQNYDGSYMTDEKYKGVVATTKPSTKPATQNTQQQQTAQKSYPYGKASETSGNIQQGHSGKQVKAIQWALNELGYGNSGTRAVDGIFGGGTRNAVINFQRAMGISADGIVGKNTRAKFKLKQYKTGGIADFTGPAWLDGTKARPELILNQRDTQNFIQLKNVLASLLGGGSKTSENSGDNTYDIDINVEKIENDYDVEQLAEKVKSLINEDARYRNNNSIRLMR